jgi:hypothetical protein
VPQIVEEGITTEELGSPPKQPTRLDMAAGMRVDGNISAVSAERDVAVNPQKVGFTDDTKETSDCQELGGSDSKAYSECETLQMDMAMETVMADKTDAEIALANRWLPVRYPDYPSTGKFEDFSNYTNQSKKIAKLNKAGIDKIKNLPTWGTESDHETKASVNIQDRDIICLKAGESVVAVSSVVHGHDNTGFYCSGAIQLS